MGCRPCIEIECQTYPFRRFECVKDWASRECFYDHVHQLGYNTQRNAHILNNLRITCTFHIPYNKYIERNLYTLRNRCCLTRQCSYLGHTVVPLNESFCRLYESEMTDPGVQNYYSMNWKIEKALTDIKALAQSVRDLTTQVEYLKANRAQLVLSGDASAINAFTQNAETYNVTTPIVVTKK